jgi:uncharacterized protein (DUF1697 family)
MNSTYLALLRGINVGGNNMIHMADLKVCLTIAGLTAVRTYIQSGNVIFESPEKDRNTLTKLIEQTIKNQFGADVPTAVFSKQEWQQIITSAPKQWGIDPGWKHNLLVMLKPYNMQQIVADIGDLKPDIEMLIAGEGVLYQSMSLALFGRTTTGKLATKPIYKRMTVRNYNTSMKLLTLL